MPAEIPETLKPEQPHDDWQQLARDAVERQGHWDLEHPGVATLYENYVIPQLQQRQLGHLALSKEDKAGGRFLDKYGSVDKQEVDRVVSHIRGNGETMPDKTGDRIVAYLNFMADTVNDGILTGDSESIRRQIDAHVIKAEDVPESYFALQRRIARELGHGDIEVTAGMHRQLIEAAQADQRGSLDKWVEYLGGDDGSYPDWFKRYTWDSVLKLGAYDKEKGKFDKRDEHTVAPYPELNREALAYAYDTVRKFHVLNESVDDVKLKQILKEGSFGRLYAYAVTEVTPDDLELRNDIRGSWTQFHQTTDPRIARRLSGSLQGHGTGWCTAGESTAETQLKGGDFYVYYTRDEDGKDTIPRVAIRMQSGEVAEVRGVLPRQELELVLADIASDKLQDLPGGEKYIQRAADMKRLTAIDKLLSKDPHAELSADDVAFLYELNHTIEGFGYRDDPRVQELQLKAANRRTAELLGQIDVTAEITNRMQSHIRIRNLVDRASHDEHPEFSDDDLSFIYELDGPIQTLDPKDHELFRMIVGWHSRHSGRDRERLLELIPAALERRYQTSHEAYEATVASLGIEAANPETLQREFATKLATWQEQGVYQYMLEQLVKRDMQFSLVMTPNILASPDQVVEAAKNFRQGHPGTLYIEHEFYSLYDATELSGVPEQGVSVRFSLMPSKNTQEIGSALVEEQRHRLRLLQDSLPSLSIHVPSVLEAISYWQFLRIRGDTLYGDSIFDKTVVNHFDLATKHLNSWSGLPRSYVNSLGRPALDGSPPDYVIGARVSVG